MKIEDYVICWRDKTPPPEQDPYKNNVTTTVNLSIPTEDGTIKMNLTGNVYWNDMSKKYIFQLISQDKETMLFRPHVLVLPVELYKLVLKTINENLFISQTEGFYDEESYERLRLSGKPSNTLH